jgi:hypothetical protein
LRKDNGTVVCLQTNRDPNRQYQTPCEPYITGAKQMATVLIELASQHKKAVILNTGSLTDLGQTTSID